MSLPVAPNQGPFRGYCVLLFHTGCGYVGWARDMLRCHAANACNGRAAWVAVSLTPQTAACLGLQMPPAGTCASAAGQQYDCHVCVTLPLRCCLASCAGPTFRMLCLPDNIVLKLQRAASRRMCKHSSELLAVVHDGRCTRVGAV